MPEEMFHIEIPYREMQLEAERLGKQPRHFDVAFGRAVRSGLRPAKTAATKILARSSGIPQKAARRRVILRYSRNRSRHRGVLFVGLSPVSLSSVLPQSQLSRKYNRNAPVSRKGVTFPKSFHQKPHSRRGKKNPYSALCRIGSSREVRSVTVPLFAENISELRKEDKRIINRIHDRFDFYIRQEIKRRG